MIGEYFVFLSFNGRKTNLFLFFSGRFDQWFSFDSNKPPKTTIAIFMEKLIIQSATILFPDAEMNTEKADIRIVNGTIEEIGKAGTLSGEAGRLISGEGKYVVPGFFDLNVNFGEPGLETKEDMVSGCAAAIAGGFTGVALQPNTLPPLHSRAEIAFIKNLSKDLMVDVHPLGTISKYRKGGELAELYDMKLSGAVAFSDGNRSVQQSGLMNRALLYSKGFGALVFSFAEDHAIAGNAKMNEGVMSTMLGMKGNPNLAEEIMVARDLSLAEYNETGIHFSTISTANAVGLIRAAKKKGVRVTCDVAAHHLLLTDERVAGFDSNFKVSPPLRTEVDRKALLKGLRDGTIDAIVSQHTPHEIEYKKTEFEKAEFGISALQTVLPVVLKAGLPLALLVDKLAVNPRKILNLPQPELKVGAEANFILIDPEERWHFDQQTNRSKSANSPFFDTELQGKVDFAINRGHSYIS